MRNILFLFFSIALMNAAAQMPQLSSGKLVRYAHFRSAFVDARNVDVWMPDGYTAAIKYDVLYMHDGQMLFDSATTWNKQEWGVDEVAGELLRAKKIRNCIIVAIWNTPKRRVEYYPAKAFDLLAPAWQDSLRKDGEYSGRPLSDDYLRFIVKELKPFIDSAYSTKKDRAHTFIAGSSMGGLISLYAICEYPDVFGGAACMSTHWPGTVKRNVPDIAKGFMDYMKTHLPDPAKHRFYFDRGDQTLDSWYAPYQLLADAVMKAKGYNAKNWVTRIFPGADHSERSWHARLQTPILFLLGMK